MKRVSCPERQRFQEELEFHTGEYERTLEILRVRERTTPAEKHAEIVGSLLEIKLKLDAARETLDLHVRRHGCA